jgi:hypothetical protein
VIYEFRCSSCGKREERSLPASKAPMLGERLYGCLCGGDVIRVLSMPTVNAEYQRASNQYPYVEHKFRHLKGCEHHDAKGSSVILSRRHEAEVCAMNGLTRM